MYVPAGRLSYSCGCFFSVVRSLFVGADVLHGGQFDIDFFSGHSLPRSRQSIREFVKFREAQAQRGRMGEGIGRGYAMRGHAG